MAHAMTPADDILRAALVEHVERMKGSRRAPFSFVWRTRGHRALLGHLRKTALADYRNLRTVDALEALYE